MKQKSIILTALLAFSAFLLTAFYIPFGGEGYEISIDNKLVLRQHGSEMKHVKNIQFTKDQKGSTMHVKFFHCGLAGKSRTLELRTPGKTVLKKWEFKNEEAQNFLISVPVKSILDFQDKAGAGTLYLVYASKEAPDGRLLAGIVRAEKSVVGK